MDLTAYTSITGATVASADQQRVTAEIARARRKLENLLGYTLDSSKRNTNLYNELGKTTSEFSCPIVNTDDLEAPDAVVDAYRLFDFSYKDIFNAVDPFTELNKVKLVYVLPGASPNGVTVRTFDNNFVRQHSHGDTWSKYIQDFRSYLPSGLINFTWACSCTDRHSYQLAIDADWGFSAIPDDLLDVWADMVTYYSDDDRDMRSESVLTHSWAKFDRGTPEALPDNMKIIQKYAGPNGTANRTVVA